MFQVHRIFGCIILLSFAFNAKAELFSAKRNYDIRQQVIDALVLTVPIRQALHHHHHEHGGYPGVNDSQAIMLEHAVDCDTCSIALAANTGTILIAFDDRAHEAIQGQVLMVTLAAAPEYAGDMTCRSDTIEDDHLPHVCRSGQ